MGQYKVLIGYSLLIWGIFIIFSWTKQVKLELKWPDLRKHLVLGLAIGLVAYAGSLHFGGFLIGILGIILLIKLISSGLVKQLTWTQIFSAVLVLILAVLPAAGLVLSRYYDRDQFDFYSQNLSALDIRTVFDGSIQSFDWLQSFNLGHIHNL